MFWCELKNPDKWGFWNMAHDLLRQRKLPHTHGDCQSFCTLGP